MMEKFCMTYITREIECALINQKSPKAIVVFGPRRSGKTTLLRTLTAGANVLWFNGDFPEDIEALKLNSASDARMLLSQVEAIVIDEAQRFPDIGLTLKRLVDCNEVSKKPTKILVSGSSSLDLAKGVKESAVGRLLMRRLWPMSLRELATNLSWVALTQSLSERLLYGMYPDVLLNPENARVTLQDYVDGILFKDLFSLSGIRLNARFEHLVYLLASSVGSEVSFESLAKKTGLNKTTVADYITLLEDCFIIKVCHSFSRNLANELKKGKKIYFCDNGIRNAILRDFSPISVRQDSGALWENFFFMERIKLHDYRQDFTEVYFWRTTGRSPQEIDFIEKRDAKLEAFECKLNDKARAAFPEAFRESYPGVSLRKVTPRNFAKFFS